MIKNNCLALIFWFSAAYAQDVTVEVPAAHKGEVNIRETLTLCSDNTFETKLISLGLTPTEISQFHQPFYTTINTRMLEQKAELDIGTWSFSHPNCSQTNYDEKGNRVFVATKLIDDVGIFIHSPNGAAFMHMDRKDWKGEKLYNLIYSLPSNVCDNAVITLVSSGYSKVFTAAYMTLKSIGFSNIVADIEPAVIIRPSPNEVCKYVKASTLNTELKYLQRATYETIMSYNNKNQIVASRSLIAHAQIGSLYMFKNYQYRHVDIKSNYDTSKDLLSIIKIYPKELKKCPKQINEIINF